MTPATDEIQGSLQKLNLPTETPCRSRDLFSRNRRCRHHVRSSTFVSDDPQSQRWQSPSPSFDVTRSNTVGHPPSISSPTSCYLKPIIAATSDFEVLQPTTPSTSLSRCRAFGEGKFSPQSSYPLLLAHERGWRESGWGRQVSGSSLCLTRSGNLVTPWTPLIAHGQPKTIKCLWAFVTIKNILCA